MVQRSAGFFITLFLGVILTTVGFAVTYFVGLPLLQEAKASREWPTCDGVITVARVETRRERRDGKTRTMYSHHIEYRYEVDGEQLTGDRVWLTDGNTSSSMPSGATAAVASYPVGKAVTVYYDPAAPAVCVLEPGTTWTTYMPAGIGGLFLVIGLLLVGSLMLKIVAGVFFVGAATTTYASQARPAAAYANESPLHPPPADGDDGIGIGE